MICPHQIAKVPDDIGNPYRQYILPLAYEHVAPLYAILGLSACHQGIQQKNKEMHENEAVRYQLNAIRALAALLMNDGKSVLSEGEQDALLATIQILILHDVSSVLMFSIFDPGMISEPAQHGKDGTHVLDQNAYTNPRSANLVFQLMGHTSRVRVALARD